MVWLLRGSVYSTVSILFPTWLSRVNLAFPFIVYLLQSHSFVLFFGFFWIGKKWTYLERNTP